MSAGTGSVRRLHRAARRRPRAASHRRRRRSLRERALDGRPRETAGPRRTLRPCGIVVLVQIDRDEIVQRRDGCRAGMWRVARRGLQREHRSNHGRADHRVHGDHALATVQGRSSSARASARSPFLAALDFFLGASDVILRGSTRVFFAGTTAVGFAEFSLLSDKRGLVDDVGPPWRAWRSPSSSTSLGLVRSSRRPFGAANFLRARRLLLRPGHFEHLDRSEVFRELDFLSLVSACPEPIHRHFTSVKRNAAT